MLEVLNTLEGLTDTQRAALVKMCGGDWGKLATLTATNGAVFAKLTKIDADIVPMINLIANVHVPSPASATPTPTPTATTDPTLAAILNKLAGDEKDADELGVKALIKAFCASSTRTPEVGNALRNKIGADMPLFAMTNKTEADFDDTWLVWTKHRRDGLTQYNGKPLATLNTLMAEAKRYSPFSLKLIVIGDMWSGVKDEALLMVHYGLMKGFIPANADEWAVNDEAKAGAYRRLAETASQWNLISHIDSHADVVAAKRRMMTGNVVSSFDNAPRNASSNITVNRTGNEYKDFMDYVKATFNMESLDIVVRGLGCDPEDIRGTSLSVRIDETHSFFKRRGMLDELKAEVSKANPKLWSLYFPDDSSTAVIGNNNTVAGNKGIAIQGSVVGDIVNGDYIGRDKITTQINHYGSKPRW